MLDKFKNSVLGDRVNYNSAAVSLLATNLYNKVKQKGILSQYVEREREIDFFNVEHTGALIEDTDFTFERCLTGQVTLAETLNFGKIHTISYERKFVASTQLTYQAGSSDTITFPAIDPGFYTVKIVRFNKTVSLYADSLLIGTDTLTVNDDYEATTELINVTDRIGNYKVTSRGKILHWWKFSFTIPSEYKDDLNSIFASDELMYNDYLLFLDKFILPAEIAIFLDEGLNDEDFYSLWYPIAFMFSAIINYSQSILDVKGNIDVVRLFLESKNIGLNNSLTDDDLVYLYQNWVQEIGRRGSIKIIEKKQLDKGVAKKLTSNQAIMLKASVASSFLINASFKSKFTEDITFRILNFLTIAKTSTNYTATCSYTDTGGTLVNFSKAFVFEEVGIINVRFYITENKTLLLLFNDKVVINEIIDIASLHVIQYLIDTIEETSSSNYLLISNLKTYFNSQTLIYKLECDICNIEDEILQSFENQVYFIELSTNLLILPAFLNVVDNDFKNKNYYPVDGELLRLINFKEGDENAYALIENSRLGQCNGVSYQNSQQSYPITNLNKFYNKNYLFKSLSQLPFTVNAYPNIDISTGGELSIKTIANEYIGIKAIVNFSAFKLPIEITEDYEISFRVKFPSIMLFRFGASFKTIDGSDITVIQKAIDGTTVNNVNAYLYEGNSTSFMTGNWVWIRGIIRNSSFAFNSNESLNIGIGSNLIMTGDSKYLLPIFEFQSTLDNEEILIKDVNIRPLILPILKGYLGSKNIIISYLKNNSGKNKDDIKEIVKNQYAPYNASIVTKFI